MKLYKISEFSKKTGLSADTLRYYHKIGILCPSNIDMDSGYRYYADNILKKTTAIITLTKLNFSLEEIKYFFSHYKNTKHIVYYLNKKVKELDKRIKKDKEKRNQIVAYMRYENRRSIAKRQKITIKTIKDMLVMGIRFKGHYKDFQKYHDELAKDYGKYFIGRSINLCYGPTNKKNELDLEILVPSSQRINKGKIKTRLLKGGKAAVVYHQVSFKTLPASYKKLSDYIKKHNLELIGLPREIGVLTDA